MSTELLYGIGGLILGFVLNIASNLVSPRVEKWLEARSISARGKSLEKLQAEYRVMKHFHENPMEFQLILFGRIILTLARVLIFLALSVVYPFIVVFSLYAQVDISSNVSVTMLYLLAVGFLLFSESRDLNKLVVAVKRVSSFEAYEKNVLARIVELEKAIEPSKAKKGD